VTEPDTGLELGQPGFGRRLCGFSTDPQPRSCSPQEQWVAGRFGRGDEQQPLRLVRQSIDPPPEAHFDASRKRYHTGELQPHGELRGCQPAWKLEQCERIAAGLGDDLVADPCIESAGQDRIQEFACISLRQARDRELPQPGQVVAGNARREDQPDRFCAQTARRDRQDQRGRKIKPLLVIDEADERPFVGNLGEQAQDRQPDQKPVCGRPVAHAERGAQRVTLWDREALEPIEHGRAQLV
jgi:hypothetical protein